MNIHRILILVMSVAIAVTACGTDNKSASAEQQTPSAPSPQAPTSLDKTVKAETGSVDESGWYHDWDEGIAAAKQSGKPVLVDFYTDWCKWCKVMDEKTFSDSEVKTILSENWVTIKLDAENTSKMGSFNGQTMTYRQMTGAFGVKGFPSYLFINKKGEAVTVIPNYWEKEKFIPILEYFHQEKYLDEVNLMEYIESKT